MTPARYVLITPVRNEGDNFRKTVTSILSQTIRPALWVIVDDGSNDSTGSIADEAACANNWVRVLHLPDRGYRSPGSGVMEAFHHGLLETGNQSWDFLGKFDGDLSVEPGYFQQCLLRFEQDQLLGIGGGLVCSLRDEKLVEESQGDPSFHVRGAVKIYKRACWKAIGGLIKLPGWDTVDELKANMLGWKTLTFPELTVHQLKETGSADGTWTNWVKNGRANYITGYHPLFMLAKCAKRIFERPYVIGASALAWGFLRSFLRDEKQINDVALVRYVRGQQLRRLTARTSIWS